MRDPYPGSVRPPALPIRSPYALRNPVAVARRAGMERRLRGLSGPARLDFEGGPIPVAARTFNLVTKSYIAPIGSIGSIGLRCLDPFTMRLNQFALTTQALLGGGERPTSNAMDGTYRLFSRRALIANCSSGTLVVTRTPLSTDVGMEGPLRPPALTVRNDFLRRISPTEYQFGWLGLGRPHMLAEAGFQYACPRLSKYIWHEVRGRISCGPSGPTLFVTVQGSRFPTHRLWVDGVARAAIPQGSFSQLWDSFPGEASRIREV